MLGTTNLEIVRRMRGPREIAGGSRELRDYVRMEYRGDAEGVLREITRAGRATPAADGNRGNPESQGVAARVAGAFASLFARPRSVR